MGIPMADCIFCAIVAGEAPARRVWEDERTIAFLDIFPLTRGHTLVVPRRHSDSILDADPEDVAAVARTAQRVAQVLKADPPEGLGAEGINLLQTNGAIALQTVFHLHFHVLPRYRGDGFRVEFTRQRGDEADLEMVAGVLRGWFTNGRSV